MVRVTKFTKHTHTHIHTHTAKMPPVAVRVDVHRKFETLM